MKSRTILGVVAAILVVGMVSMVALAVNDGTLGNGAPQAKLLGKLNIIGVAKDKNANMDNAGGSAIFVALGSTGEVARTKILLSVGEDFAVLDKNGTDGQASFQLPDPNLDPYIIGEPGGADTETAYSVFVRPLGKPGGWTTITTCAELLDSTFAGLLPQEATRILNRSPDPNVYCSIEQVGSEITLRTNGKDGKVSFTNVSAQLLTIVFSVEIDIDDTTESYLIRVPIFDPILQGEYWEYDNNGLKLLQVRFYDVSTDVTDADLAL
jgi:hypothetical protein